MTGSSEASSVALWLPPFLQWTCSVVVRTSRERLEGRFKFPYDVASAFSTLLRVQVACPMACESAALEIVRVAAHYNEASDSDGEGDGLLGPHGGRQTEKMAAKHRGRERLVVRERTKQ